MLQKGVKGNAEKNSSTMGDSNESLLSLNLHSRQCDDLSEAA